MQVYAFVMSIMWIYISANFLIDLLQLFGILTGFPASLLGLTVLAWGNSIGDLIANVSISRKGFAEMALTGCVATPLFNLLWGLGLSTFMLNI